MFLFYVIFHPWLPPGGGGQCLSLGRSVWGRRSLGEEQYSRCYAPVSRGWGGMEESCLG